MSRIDFARRFAAHTSYMSESEADSELDVEDALLAWTTLPADEEKAQFNDVFGLKRDRSMSPWAGTDGFNADAGDDRDGEQNS